MSNLSEIQQIYISENEETIKDLEENVKILENVVEEHDVIIHSLKQDLEATTQINVAVKKWTVEEDDYHIDGENTETTSNKTGFNCDTCVFVGYTLCELNVHVREKHGCDDNGAT